MRDSEADLAKALQAVVDMITDSATDGRMSARVAMLLRLIEARVEQDAYHEMLKELSRFIEVEIRDVEAAQILAWEDAVLGKLTRQGSDQTPTK